MLASAATANAASVSYFLNQTNANGDNVNYLEVMISDATFEDDASAIRFDVTVLDPLTSNANNNFGIQSFGFNTMQSTADVLAAIVGLPTGWSADADRNQSGFGNFDLVVAGTGGNRQDPTLSFFVSGINGDVVADYAVLSAGNASEGNVFFAAHVAGFKDQDGAFFGGPAEVVPVPAAVWLLGSALGVFGWIRRRADRARSDREFLAEQG